MVSGITYTKRGREELRKLVTESDSAALATSCTSGVLDMSFLLYGASGFNAKIGSWDTSSVTTMRGMFEGAPSFNQDISEWNTGSVEDFHGIFYGASSFNKDISKWNTASATSMSSMFSEATAFNNGGKALSWADTGNVVSMSYMFSKASAFNQDISTWSTGSVKNMFRMFSDATSFNQDISKWNTDAVTSMHSMFLRATSFNQDISEWKTAKVMDMQTMFESATSFNQDLSSWNVVRVGSICTRFEVSAGAWTLPKPSLPASCIGFTISTNGVTVLCPIATLGDTGVVKGVTYTKRDRQGLLELKAAANDAELAKSCTSGVTDMSGMFKDAASFNEDIGSWDTSSVTTMEEMFNGASTFNKDVSKWNTAAVTSMASMFESATAFNQDVSKWNTAAVTSMANTFNGATSFNRDLSSWNVDKVGSTCTRFEVSAGAWTLSKPSLPASCIAFSHRGRRSHGSLPRCQLVSEIPVWSRASTYTKRDRQGLLELKVAASDDAELAKSCTCGVTDMSGMFKDAASFNGEHWQLGHELGDDHGGHVQRRQHLQPGPQSSWNVDKVGSTCTNFEANTGATWTLPKPSLPAMAVIGFATATNGVTVLCPTAAVGDTGVVKGVDVRRSATGRACWRSRWALPTRASWPSRARVA